MKLVVAVLETMYGGKGSLASKFFIINPENVSGARLYSLINGHARLLVTNACKERVQTARQHGVPDPLWLAGNLQTIALRRRIDLVLLCGQIAQKTYRETELTFPVLEIPHPAARNWSHERVKEIQEEIRKRLTE